MVPFGLNSEYKALRSVLLYKPGREIHQYPVPSEIEHLRKIDHNQIATEFDHIIKTFQGFNINVILIDDTPLSNDRKYLYNMMYCRDLMFITPAGAIVGNMANSSRKEEILYAQKTLNDNNIPVLHVIEGEGRFEGADALWVNDKLVILGVGNRTNNEAFGQIKKVLGKIGVGCVALPSCQTKTQHLLGTVQFVDNDMVLVRHEICDNAVIEFLEKKHFTIIRIPENIEVTTRQAMNIVCIAPRKVRPN